MGLVRTRIAVIIARLGPYHAARMAAVARRFGAEEVLAIEVARESREYAWDRVVSAGFRRRTLISDRDYQDVGSRELRRHMLHALEEDKPETVAVSGWGFPEARAAIAWCRRRDRTAVLMSESQERDTPRRWPKELLKRALLRAVDAALVGGRRHADYLRRLGFDRERIAVGYDVVDNEHFAAGARDARAAAPTLRARLGLPERYLLSSARFVAKKNLARLLEAYAMYRRQLGPQAWDLVLVGDGPERSRLESLRARLGIERSVYMPGFRQYAELPAYYGLASAFILPSVAEQWGLVVNEAMAAGVPVLVSHSCGAAELVAESQNGYRFDPESLADMAHAMARITADEDRLVGMGEAAAAVVAQRSPDVFAMGLEAALEAGDRYRRSRTRRWTPNAALWF